jgi:type I restriction enzyme S subunit
VIADLKPYPEYRESGLPRLGQVPAHWSVRRIKTILRETDHRSADESGTLLSLTRVRGLIPHKDMTEKMHSAKTLVGYKRYRAGQLVMNRMQAWSGMFGAGAIDGLVSPDYAVFDVLGGNAVNIVLERLKTPDLVAQFALESKGIGSGFNRLYTDRFGAIPISLPTPDEQEAIMRFLYWANGRLNRAIRAKRKVIVLLNEQKQAIIHRTVTRGLDPSVPLKPSGIPWLGDIPQHWEARRLKSILACRLTNGVFKRGDAFGSGVPLVNVADIYAPDGHIRPDNLERVRATHSEVETFRVLSGDLFFVRSSLKLEGTGRCAFAESLETDTVFECHVVRARPDQRRIMTRFLAMFLSSWTGVNNTVSRANTVTMSTLGQGAINSLPVILPPLPEQRDILELVDAETSPLTAAISRLEREIELLREYRTRLVADVVTGKLDVREVAARLPEEIPPDTIENATDLDDEINPTDEEAAE